MKRIMTLLASLPVVCSLLSFSAFGQYQMEYFDRGVVAVRAGNNNFVSWRWLG